MTDKGAGLAMQREPNLLKYTRRSIYLGWTMFTTSVVSVISIVLLYSYSTSVHCASVDPDSHDCLPVDDKPQCVCKIQNNGSIIDLTSIRTM